MSKAPISLAGITMIGAGSILAWAGIKGYSVMTAIQNIIQGEPIGVNTATAPLTTGDGVTVVDSGIGSALIGGNSNRSIAQSAAVLYGWTGAEWDALDKLWQRESSWNNKAENKSSHAYGIPQALPYTKMPPAAWPERVGGKSDAPTQIQWGLAYIKGRYGRPTMAWAHEQSNNWY
jgi:resuscitation-promoting factor RpfB